LNRLAGTIELPCGVAVVDEGGRVRQANAALGRLLGQPAADLVSLPFDSLLAPAAAVLYQSYLLPLLRLHGEVGEFELVLKSADGARPSVLFYAAVRPLADGCDDGMDVVVVPVRERRRVADELLRVKRAADLAPGMMFQLVRSPQGQLRFAYVSQAVRALYGVSAEAAAADAQAVLGQLHPEDAARLQARLAASGAGAPAAEWANEAWTELLRVQRPGAAPAWHEMHAAPQPGRDGTGVWHGFVADATLRLQLAAERAEHQSAEAQARARSELLARISHEFRTPLNAIIGFSQLLTRPDADALSPRQRQQLQTIAGAGASLLHLVNDVLELSALDSTPTELHCSAVPLRPLLAQALALVEPQAVEAGVTLAPLQCDDALQALADAQRLGQVLANLLSNAVKYNVRGGQVALQATAHGAEQVCITIADSGPGFTPEQQARLYEPFNRLGAERSGRPGTGLGLVITRNLVKLMGGAIGLHSEVGRGACFSVTLPQATGSAGLAPSPPRQALADGGSPAAAEVPSGRDFDVLYVEDDEVNTVLMQAILALRPAVRLQLAADATTALAQALRRPPALLLVDLHLPDADGFTLVQRMRTHAVLARVPVVLVSAATGAGERERAEREGFVACWAKPLDVAQTLAALDSLMAAATARG